MRWVCACLLLTLFAHPAGSAEFVPQSARHIPVVHQADVIVVGGTLGAVAAATEAAREGARVLLVGARPSVGEDLCATMHLWLEEPEPAPGELTGKIFSGRRTTTPLCVKQVLEAALLEAGADFLLCCYPTDLLVDRDGAPAGIVMANRAGRQAVIGKVIVDATERAIVAGWAGAQRRPWVPGEQSCRRVVLGGKAGRREVPAREVPAGITTNGQEPLYYEYTLDLDLGDGSFAALARAEHRARDITYREGQLRAAERLFFVPTDSILGEMPPAGTNVGNPFPIQHFTAAGCTRLYVLSASADIPRDQVQAGLRPDSVERTGRMIGRAAARQARGLGTPREVSLKVDSAPPGQAGDVREVLHGLRPTDRLTQTVSAGACGVPVLADVDVVIVGGGTSGACAAIGAARQGVKVLVVEYQEGLGGVGTLGLIGRPYHGRLSGFTREVPFCDKDHNTESKMEWFRSEIRKAGGEVWLGVLGCGAFLDGNVVKGVLVATPLGRGAIRAKVVIDATGNADVAVAAGAEAMFGGDAADIALQGTGLPQRSPGATYVNTDYLLVDEADVRDVWRAFVGVRLTSSAASYDMGPLIQSRERRRVVGDHVLSYLDQIAGRTYPDSIVFSGSDYDSHGYPSEPYFALIPHTEQTRKANHPAPGGTCYTPYRCLLPRGLEGLLVIGLGMSMHRDATAMVRMQLDLHNQGYAAGVAAALAVRSDCTPRRIDVKALQKHLVEIGNLPENVLTDRDSFPLPDSLVHAAVRDYTDGTRSRAARCEALAIILTHTEVARAPLKQAFAAATGEARIDYAKLLGCLGERDVVPTLIARLEEVTEWDAKIDQGVMAEYAHLPTPIDALILALGGTHDREAVPALLKKLDTLNPDVTLSHHRALALALEQLAAPAAAEPLARLLNQPGMRGHAMKGLEPLVDKPVEQRRRLAPLREIVLARALYRCGDWQGLGERILRDYQQDIRGVFARHASAVLAAGHGRGSGRMPEGRRPGSAAPWL
ncbi:MAG: FAD-dependent oxidoreductase [Planctomycetes bacterium]|nr:FAD-dependent oxidoreductase [Planctomycetota bacterium]